MRDFKEFYYNISYIQQLFGEHVSFKLKKWIHHNYKIVKLHAHIYSLNSFLHNDLCPPFL